MFLSDLPFCASCEECVEKEMASYGGFAEDEYDSIVFFLRHGKLLDNNTSAEKCGTKALDSLRRRCRDFRLSPNGRLLYDQVCTLNRR
ncbi:MAG: hypothetical protein GY820_31350 [Gammaproteobacteria bacterium]|nr:hypothetical protein [Gammaproteobacteria bacterium]